MTQLSGVFECVGFSVVGLPEKKSGVDGPSWLSHEGREGCCGEQKEVALAL